MRVEDYFSTGERWWFRLHAKGGNRHELPAHHNAESYIDEYLEAAGIGDDKKGPLFRTTVWPQPNALEEPDASTRRASDDLPTCKSGPARRARVLPHSKSHTQCLS